MLLSFRYHRSVPLESLLLRELPGSLKGDELCLELVLVVDELTEGEEVAHQCSELDPFLRTSAWRLAFWAPAAASTVKSSQCRAPEGCLLANRA